MNPQNDCRSQGRSIDYFLRLAETEVSGALTLEHSYTDQRGLEALRILGRVSDCLSPHPWILEFFKRVFDAFRHRKLAQVSRVQQVVRTLALGLRLWPSASSPSAELHQHRERLRK